MSRIWFLLRCALWSLALSAAAAGQTPSQGGEIRLGFKIPLKEPVAIGSSLDIPIRIAWQGLPDRARIYVHLMTLRGDKWVTQHEGEFSGSNFHFQFSGGMAESQSSLFSFSSQNYPVSLIIKKDLLKTLVKNLATVDDSTATKFADEVSNTETGYDLALAFLTSAGPSNSADATLRITVPDYPVHYDGILITPFVLAYDSKNQPYVYQSSKDMTSLRIAVTPNRPRPVEKAKKNVSLSDVPGEVTIKEYTPQTVTVGSPNSVKLKVEYRNLLPGTAVYVAALPFDKEKYILGKYAATLPSIKGLLAPTLSQEESKIYRFAVENKPIEFDFVAGQKLEAGLVGIAPKGGSGVLEGTVTFSPPAYVNLYERVHFIPMLLIPTDQGSRVLIDSERMQGPKILVSGNG